MDRFRLRSDYDKAILDCTLKVQRYNSMAMTSAEEMRREHLVRGKPITIGEDCWLGANVTVLPGVTIGDRCIIGAGSVVTKDVPNDSVYVGNPAHPI